MTSPGSPLPRTATDCSVAVFGVLALTLGAIGILAPDTQYRMGGFELVSQELRALGDYTPAVMGTTSVAAVNMGILYLTGTALKWPGFPLWTVWARTVMAAGFVGFIWSGRASKLFVGAAVWEGLGALSTLGAMWWDGRSQKTKQL